MKFLIKENVFNSCCSFHIGTPFESTKKLIEKMRHKDDTINWDSMKGVNGYCVTCKLKDESTGHLIWMEKYDWSCTSMAILVHEIAHLVMSILDHKSIPIRKENDEVFAYLLERYTREALWMTRKMHPQHKEITKKKKRA